MPRSADVTFGETPAGVLEEADDGAFLFRYHEGYEGPPISLTMPVAARELHYTGFPPFFEGLLPEGAQLEALLRQEKLDRDDLFGQLITVGGDLVGAVTVRSRK